MPVSMGPSGTVTFTVEGAAESDLDNVSEADFLAKGDSAGLAKEDLSNTTSTAANNLDVRNVSKTGIPAAPFFAVGSCMSVVDTGNGGGYGQRLNYYCDGTGDGVFKIGAAVLADYRGLSAGGTNGHGNSLWVTAGTPDDNSRSFGVFAVEVNPVNRAGDNGYFETRAAATPNWAGGIQVVAETQDLFASGDSGFNILYGYMTGRSASVNPNTGKYAKIYNGFMAERDSIAPNGVGFLAAGDTLGVLADYPATALRVRDTWKRGVDLNGATLSTNIALRMDRGQGIGYAIAADGSTEETVIRVAAAGSNLLLKAPVAGGRVELESILQPRTYTVGTLPSAATADGLIFVSNDPAGRVLAYSDGTDWRRVLDGGIVNSAVSSAATVTEGTFTPTLYGGTTAGTNTYTVQLGRYTRVGSTIHVQGHIVLSAKDAAMAGPVFIGGLPLAVVATPTDMRYSFAVRWTSVDLAASYSLIAASLSPGATAALLVQSGDNIAATTIDAPAISATSVVTFFGSYRVA